MGYKLPDGRYVDDQGKTHASYNDALAESRTRSRRDLESGMLAKSQAGLTKALNDQEIARREKALLGWIPGLGTHYDRRLQRAANDAAYAEAAVGARVQQLAATNARMGAGAVPAMARQEASADPVTTRRDLDAPVLSDDVDARASEARRMLQQATPYWEREENKGMLQAAQVGGGPRAGEAGYAQRVDIQAWMEANKNAPKGADGKNIVDRFLEQQQKRGLLDSPGQGNPVFGGTRIAMPADAESAVQAGTRGLVGYEGNALAQAQANVSDLQGRERAALTEQVFRAATEGRLPDIGIQPQRSVDVAFNYPAGIPGAAEAFSGLEVGQPFTSPEMNRQLASLGQPAAVQAVATGTGSGATLQPASAAASETGVEPAQPDAPGNRPNPADELARQYIETLRNTRAARLGS